MSRFNLKRVGYAVLFVAFLVELTAIAPHGGSPWSDIWKLSTFQPPANNPAVLSVFWIAGLQIMMYWPLVLGDRRSNPLPRPLVCMAMLLFGSLALLPYLAARSTGTPAEPPVQPGILRSRTYGTAIAIALAASLLFGILLGNALSYAKLFRTDFFLHGMTIDCVLLALLFPALLRDELNGLGYYEDNAFFRLVIGLPIFGPALYLATQPHPR